MSCRMGGSWRGAGRGDEGEGEGIGEYKLRRGEQPRVPAVAP